MNDEDLLSYLGNFCRGFEDKTQRRHLRKRGWIEYARKSWYLTIAGREAARERGIIEGT